MIRSVGFFLRGDPYDWGISQTESFAKALKRQGVEVEYFGSPEAPLREVLMRQRHQLPDITCSLMDLSIGEEFHPLLGHHKIPYVLYSVDLSTYYLYTFQDENNIMTSIDLEDVEFMRSIGFQRTFHLPLACERDIECNLSEDKPYPITYIGTCWDYQSMLDHWKKKNYVCSEIMMETVKRVFEGESQIRVMLEILNKKGLSISDVPFCSMQRDLTVYTKGKDRVEAIRNIHHIPVHIFGVKHLSRGWSQYLAGKKNIYLHPAVSFKKSLEIMRQSKVLLNGSPQFLYGIHDRVFNGLGSGALVITDDNAVIRNHFTDEEDILLYKLNNYAGIEDKIAPYIENHKKRNELVVSGRNKVLAAHTWDHRAKRFLEKVSSILEGVPC